TPETENRTMTHLWHDDFRHRHIPAHHIDPRSKLGVAFLFVITLVCSRHLHPVQTAGFILVIAIGAGLSGVSVNRLLRRVASLMPLVLLLGVSTFISQTNIRQAGLLIGRSVLCMAVLALAVMTTPFPDVVRALQQCRAPRLLVTLLAFVYRYAAVLRDETLRLERGWSARYFGRSWLRNWASLGHILASLFIRAFERAERVYAAMLARGFSSETKAGRLLHFTGYDAAFIGASLAILMMLREIRI
ncbi:MAG TPA: cobalt ECF transporter T component CbiQ, partial [Elusimicrobiota bacterium]|nr:cobalt ECF transporter T component CbiQ [Elusimicrobiota bacterium]